MNTNKNFQMADFFLAGFDADKRSKVRVGIIAYYLARFDKRDPTQLGYKNYRWVQRMRAKI